MKRTENKLFLNRVTTFNSKFVIGILLALDSKSFMTVFKYMLKPSGLVSRSINSLFTNSAVLLAVRLKINLKNLTEPWPLVERRCLVNRFGC